MELNIPDAAPVGFAMPAGAAAVCHARVFCNVYLLDNGTLFGCELLTL